MNGTLREPRVRPCEEREKEKSGENEHLRLRDGEVWQRHNEKRKNGGKRDEKNARDTISDAKIFVRSYIHMANTITNEKRKTRCYSQRASHIFCTFKPDSVCNTITRIGGNHLSGMIVTNHLKRHSSASREARCAVISLES